MDAATDYIPSARPDRPRRAFTLTELLVVMGIVILLVVVGIPGFNAVFGSTRLESAEAVLSSASALARAFAVQARTGDLPYEAAGGAMLFTPAGEIRIVQYDPLAKFGDTRLNDLTPPWFGYADLPNADYFALPRGVAMVGIARGGDLPDGEMQLLAPPFAVRFNVHGHLVVSKTSEKHLVVYNADADGAFPDPTDDDNRRPDDYDADAWIPGTNAYASNNQVDPRRDYARHPMPFGVIEPVVGIVAFDVGAFREAGLDFEAGGDFGVNEDAARWILNNGQPMFFNRYTGAVIRTRGR